MQNVKKFKKSVNNIKENFSMFYKINGIYSNSNDFNGFILQNLTEYNRFFYGNTFVKIRGYL